MGLIKNLRSQFKKPEGLLGSIAGMLMTIFGKEKNKWTLSLLNLKQDDHVLEIGFGPGIGIEIASKIIQNGKIIGIDFSEKMLKKAYQRNKKAIQKGKVELIHADVENLPSFQLHFDKVYSINSIIFWNNPVQTLMNIRKLMKDNGVIAITVQPFTKDATVDTAKQFGIEIVKQLVEAGFIHVKTELKQMKSVPIVCVLGVNKEFQSA